LTPSRALAIRQGPWKLIFQSDGKRELYNLQSDLGEMLNVTDANPEVVAKLAALMARYIANGRSTAGAAQKNDRTTRTYRSSAVPVVRAPRIHYTGDLVRRFGKSRAKAG
jgi:hypothetical protein